MSDYAKIEAKLTVSEAASYSPVQKETTFDAYESGAATLQADVTQIKAPTTGILVDLVKYVAITNILIKNKDATNYVEATFRTTGGAGNDQVLRIPAGGIVMLGSAITVANDLTLTANTAACWCEIGIIGTAA
jgi:hypothetical protein